MKNIFAISFVVLLILSFNSNALAFYCGNDIVSRWDKAASVQNKCGNPYNIASGIDNSKGYPENIYNWFYNCGEGDFIYLLIINNGIVVKIETVSRGTGKGQCK
jgi:hypothetical protein